MTDPERRTERTFGVTAELKPIQRRNLLNLRNSEVYPDLLDVMEMVCIETESVLMNTDPANKSAVLENHKMAKAAWLVFIHMQDKIAEESKLFLSSQVEQPPIPELTQREQWIENILDPTRPAPVEDNWANEEEIQ
jgi:hypothetical protein